MTPTLEGAVVVGLDVGGTKVLGVAVDASDPAVARAEHRIPTPEGPDALLAGLEEVVAALAAEVGRPPLAVGVGLPGLVDLGGTLRTAPHLPGVQDLAVAARLSARLGIRVEADNDANCHARAEHRIGAAKGVDEALVVTFGTGIGGGVVTGGRVLRGAVGAAGEPGHMVVDPAGPRCACGRRGCWEMYGSGTGLARLAVEAAFAGRIDAAVRLAGGRPESVRGEHVAEAARAGDAGALDVMDALAGWMALGLANLANVVDPELVVVGGGLVEAADLLLERVRAAFDPALMGAGHRPPIPVVPALLGEDAGAVGAACLVA